MLRCLDLSLRSDAVKAGTAVDRAVASREERDTGLDAAGCANCGVHLTAHPCVDPGAIHSFAARSSAIRASARLVQEAFCRIELLFTGREDELTTTFSTRQRPVRVKHLALQATRVPAPRSQGWWEAAFALDLTGTSVKRRNEASGEVFREPGAV